MSETMQKRLDQETLDDLLEKKNYAEIKLRLSSMNEVDVAELLNPLDTTHTLLIYRMLPKDLAAETFAHINKERQLGIINAITDTEVEEIVQELYFDDMIDLLEEMPANVVKRVIKNTPIHERKLINQFLRYPEDSAGSIMTIEMVHFNKEDTVGQAIKHIREIGLTKETVYTCYVTDAQRHLEGIVSLRKLITSDEDQKVKDLMETDIIYTSTSTDQESVAALFKRYGFIAIPVVDNEHRLIGIITVDDIMDIMEQEATEDFQIMAAMSPTEEEYLDASVMTLAKNRLPWLLVLMLSATFTGRIMMRFESLLSQVAILAAFIPMLMDTGGNSGNQSSTLMIRGLATGEITSHDWLKVFWKEARISLVVGAVLAGVNFLRLLVLERVSIPIALTVCATLVITVVVAKLVGGLLPLLAHKLKLDPAIMAGPLITTIVDALALMVYFGIAQAVLGI